MNTHAALIQSLGEPKSFIRWYLDTTTLKKTKGQTLAKATFNKAKKDLIKSGFVIVKEINGREKEFSLNIEHKNSLNLLAKLDDEFEKFSEVSDMPEKKIVRYRPELQKEFTQNKYFIESIIYKIEQILLCIQLYSLYVNSPICEPARRKIIKHNIEECNNVIDNIFTTISLIDVKFADQIFISLLKPWQTTPFDPKTYPEFWKNPERIGEIYQRIVDKSIKKHKP